MTEVRNELAPYAATAAHSRGRRHPEPPPALRTEFQRDRDRIIHSTAFRRLVYKTQVFVNYEGDLYRTRLTHSLEVAQIARTVARALRLNEDLVEAISLAHDLGHTPFGHAGQDALNECMREFGGFEHNLQSLRVVDQLEDRYAALPRAQPDVRDARRHSQALLAEARSRARRRRPALPGPHASGARSSARQHRRRDRLQQPRRRRRPALGPHHPRAARHAAVVRGALAPHPAAASRLEATASGQRGGSRDDRRARRGPRSARAPRRSRQRRRATSTTSARSTTGSSSSVRRCVRRSLRSSVSCATRSIHIRACGK